jgi:hypothetical protein
MNQDEEIEIVKASNEALMKRLVDGGRLVEAVVTVVLFKGTGGLQPDR